MNVQISHQCDLYGWLALAREVEPLFGPMADVPEFHNGLLAAINENQALCVWDKDATGSSRLAGGVIIDTKENEILWLVVSQASRGRGVGRSLLKEALDRMDASRRIRVQTYDSSVEAGIPARHLYMEMGFRDVRDGGLNPAGLPTVIMERPAN